MKSIENKVNAAVVVAVSSLVVSSYQLPSIRFEKHEHRCRDADEVRRMND